MGNLEVRTETLRSERFGEALSQRSWLNLAIEIKSENETAKSLSGARLRSNQKLGNAAKN